MSAPFDIDQVIARITEKVTAFQTVEGAAEYASITSLKDFRAPCAFALLAQERGDTEQMPGARPSGRQRAIVTFGIVIAVRNYRDKRGAESMDELSPLVGSCRNALMGWTPAVSGARPCRWLQGDVLEYDSNTLLWSDVYQTQHFIGGGTGS